MRHSTSSGPALNGFAISAPLSAGLNAGPPNQSTPPAPISRGPNASYATQRPLSGSNHGNAFASTAPPTPGKKSKKAATMSTASSSKAQDGPIAMARWLKEGPRAAQMDITKGKKLRMLLRQETTV